MRFHQIGRLLAAGLVLGLAPSSPAGYIFTTIANSNTAIPGGTGNFTAFSAAGPAVDAAGDVAFVGWQVNTQVGLYASVGGNLTRFVDPTTVIPGFSQTFHLATSPSFAFDNGQAAFVGGSGGSVGGFILQRRTN